MAKLNFHNQAAFTLLELLFAVTIVSLITFISVPVGYKLYEQQQIKQFFRVFDADVLFIQNQSLHQSNHYKIVLNTNSYSVSNHDGMIFKRDYPKQISYRNTANNKISFYRHGTIENPGTFFFYVHDGSRYKVVFPFGKGRHYIEKQ